MGSSIGAVKQETFNSDQKNGAEQLGEVGGGGGRGNAGDLEEAKQKHFHLLLLLPFLLTLFHRVNVNGETNGRLHSRSGRGTVLSAPERQVRRPAGPPRHLRQPRLEQSHPERDQPGKSPTVNFFCDDSS